MTVATLKPPISPDEMLNLPDSVAFELVEGQLVRRNMGAESSEIGARILGVLAIFFLRVGPMGKLFGSDASYKCFSKSPGKVRRADVGFVARGRLPGDKSPKGHILIAPDLAVEVVLPNDTAEEVDQKIFEWLEAGARLVWIVSASIRTVRVHRPRAAANGPISILSAEDQITGEDVLPGFTTKVMDFFEA